MWEWWAAAVHVAGQSRAVSVPLVKHLCSSPLQGYPMDCGLLGQTGFACAGRERKVSHKQAYGCAATGITNSTRWELEESKEAVSEIESEQEAAGSEAGGLGGCQGRAPLACAHPWMVPALLSLVNSFVCLWSFFFFFQSLFILSVTISRELDLSSL